MTPAHRRSSHRAGGHRAQPTLPVSDWFVMRVYPPFPCLIGPQVKMAAMFDLLFSEADRHGQNVFLATNSDIQLIDNEGAFGTTNSMFLPGTQKVPSPRVDFRPANGSLSAGNIRRIFRGIFEMPFAEWYTSVDSRRPFWPSTPGLGRYRLIKRDPR